MSKNSKASCNHELEGGKRQKRTDIISHDLVTAVSKFLSICECNAKESFRLAGFEILSGLYIGFCRWAQILLPAGARPFGTEVPVLY